MQKLGIRSVGIDANPTAHFVSTTKTTWSGDTNFLHAEVEYIVEEAKKRITGPLRTLPEESRRLLLTDSISPLPLHKILVLRECLRHHGGLSDLPHLWLAFLKTAVETASNLKFAPEVGIGKRKDDAPVIETWQTLAKIILAEMEGLAKKDRTVATVLHADSRQIADYLQPRTIDAVFTSPPYPNEKDYSRTTRLETILLGFAEDKAALRRIKKGLLRSNTRGIYREDDDDHWIADIPKIQQIAETIEERRIALGKTSGFERLYGRATKLYFGGMARHLSELRPALRPGARLGYVVGDQASYLRVMIRTGELLAQIAESLGYQVLSIDPFRKRFATATKEWMWEQVVVLQWQGENP